MKLRWSCVFGLMFALGCADQSGSQADEGPPPDGEQDGFVSEPQGKADANGIEEMSWEGLCVLKLVNTAPAAELSAVVHSWPAEGIIERRAGADGELFTADDVPFVDLDELDAVSWVGRITFSQLSRHARDNEDTYCLGLGEEQLIPGEEEAAQKIVERASQHVLEAAAQDTIARRDAHAKAHGCVKAFVDIEPSALSPEDRVGVFAQAQTYPAWIRMSNGAFSIQSDLTSDIRGFAIKLMDVPGDKILERHRAEKTIDFLLINGPSMFVRTPHDYVEMSQKAFDGNPATFFLSLDPREWKLRELFNLLGTVNKEPLDPLRARYWSTTPYKLGEGTAVKYSARPCDGEELEGRFGDHGEDLLRDGMRTHLEQTEGCFDFLIQHQLDPKTMPIEDATLEWEEDASPFIKVATIRVPMQSFESPEQEEFCENLSFNPWHTLPEHQPLGNINRTRRIVYDAISALRHDENDVAQTEPTSH